MTHPLQVFFSFNFLFVCHEHFSFTFMSIVIIAALISLPDNSNIWNISTSLSTYSLSLRLGYIFLFLLMFSNFGLYPRLNPWVRSVEILNLLTCLQKVLTFCFCRQFTWLKSISKLPWKAVKIFIHFFWCLAGLFEVCPAYAQFRSFKYLGRTYMYIFELSLWSSMFQDTPFHSALLSLPHFPFSVSSRQENCVLVGV